MPQCSSFCMSDARELTVGASLARGGAASPVNASKAPAASTVAARMARFMEVPAWSGGCLFGATRREKLAHWARRTEECYPKGTLAHRHQEPQGSRADAHRLPPSGRDARARRRKNSASHDDGGH